MAREMTPQERAAVYKYHRVFDGYNFLSGPKGMEEIVTHDMELVSLEDHEAALQQTRRAALLECANKVKDRAALWRSHGGAKIGFPYGHLTVEDECDSIADELHRLAQEG